MRNLDTYISFFILFFQLSYFPDLLPLPPPYRLYLRRCGRRFIVLAPAGRLFDLLPVVVRFDRHLHLECTTNGCLTQIVTCSATLIVMVLDLKLVLLEPHLAVCAPRMHICCAVVLPADVRAIRSSNMICSICSGIAALHSSSDEAGSRHIAAVARWGANGDPTGCGCDETARQRVGNQNKGIHRRNSSYMTHELRIQIPQRIRFIARPPLMPPAYPRIPSSHQVRVAVRPHNE